MSDEFSEIHISKRFDTSTQGRTRLQAWVSAATNMIPPEIFVYQRIPAVPGYNDGLPEDIFVHVAAYADMVAFPSDRPSVNSPYFRKSYIDLAGDSRCEMEDLWKQIMCHIQALLDDLVRINELCPARLVEASEGSSSSAPLNDNPLQGQ
jgi:hypothetical protein